MAGSRVILIGSHLGGSLAAWTQQKYPSLVDGVWANGAPLVPSDTIPGFLSSLQDVIQRTGSGRCLKALEEVFQTIRTEMEGPETPPEYFEIFEMCAGFDFGSLFDQSTFLYHLFTSISRPALRNVKKDLFDLCYELLDPEYLDVVEAFAPFFLSRQKGKGRCMDYSFRRLLNDTANRDGDVDVWAYQSCFEYGWFPGGGLDNAWLPPNFFQSLCYNAFSLLSDQRSEAQEETRRLLEGIIVNGGGGNIILSYAAWDPWAATGVDQFDGEREETREKFVLSVEGKKRFLKDSCTFLNFHPNHRSRGDLREYHHEFFEPFRLPCDAGSQDDHSE